MSGEISVKTNFTAGMIAKNLLGRGDLNVFENGAEYLQNVIIQPTGGVSRRYGTRHIAELPGKSRLIPFEFNSEQTYLICLSNKKIQVFNEEECITTLTSPWDEKQIFEISFTQSADTLLVVHKEVAPKEITRLTDNSWKISDWEYHEEDGMVFCPYFNFYQYREKVKISGTSGTADLTSTNDLFTESHVGILIKLHKGLVEITGFIDAKKVTVKVLKNLSSSAETKDWEEQSFSNLRGWPNSITFHQDRMVIGGSKSLPNRLWLSKSSDLFNFDLGTGLDDEAIEFAILSDQVNAIKSVISARHLLVFTTGAEWMVTGDPLTPGSIQLARQTSTGIYDIHPEQIDGAVVFISKNGRQLREFLYADVEQAYNSKDITLLSNEMIKSPVDRAFDASSNILYIVLADGSISTLTSYRVEEVNAWSKMTTNGKYISVCSSGEDVYLCILREDKYFLEIIDKEMFVDNGLIIESLSPRREWSGLNHLESSIVDVVADKVYVGNFLVDNGKITLDYNASEIIVGLPYEHIITPLPYMRSEGTPHQPKSFRLVSVTFRIIDSKTLQVNLGNGYFSVPLRRLREDKILNNSSLLYSGDITLRATGWIREMEKNMWSIKDGVPLSFTLLSVVSEIKNN